MDFIIIQENKADNVLLIYDELFSAFQMNFHCHRYFYDL